MAHPPPLHPGEERDDVLAALLRQLEDEVGRAVGLHAGQQLRDLRV
jgi:hypothetical protein